MTGETPRDGGARSTWFEEVRIFVRTDAKTRYFRISGFGRICLAVLLIGGAVWTAVATVSLGIGWMEQKTQALRFAQTRQTLTAQIDALTRDRDQMALALTESRERASALAQQMSRQHIHINDAAENEQELEILIAALRAKLRKEVRRRDAALRDKSALQDQLAAVETRLEALSGAEDELADTLETISLALNSAVLTRDAAMESRDILTEELAAIQEDIRRDDDRRQRLYGRLEEAVQTGLGQLETLFDRAGLDVDRLVNAVRKEYSGEGGPFLPVSALGAGGADAPSPEDARIAALMSELERVNLMRIAATRLPFAMPVRSAVRMTSRFGVRRDPFNGRHRQHNGVDYAGPTGLGIHTTADGEVVFAGWKSGYGRVIQIRHGFGHETVYAHLRKIRVERGQRVARGERIGDMGSSGRSTGTHLHYEVRLNGKAVNPVTYIEAARHVF